MTAEFPAAQFPAAQFPQARPRRLRRTPALRRLVAQTSVRPADLLLPMFIKEGISEPQPVVSMPGVVQHTRDSLRKAAAAAVDAGVGGLVLFAVPAAKDARGSAADDPDGILALALRDLASEVGATTCAPAAAWAAAMDPYRSSVASLSTSPEAVSTPQWP